MLLRRGLLAGFSALAAGSTLLLFGAVASASTITLSTVSSDETPAGILDATFEFDIVGGNTLQLLVTNDTSAPNEFNVNSMYFNGSSDVSSLSLISATHSVEGNVFSFWEPVETSVQVAGFGVFDFGLTDIGVGETDPSLIGPSEGIAFVLSITGVCADSFSCTMADFATPNGKSHTAAAKFVNGPGDNSAFGAVPEPATALLFGLGLLGLGMARRRR